MKAWLLGMCLVGTGLTMAGAQTPNFGPNVAVFTPGMPAAAIQAKIDAAYAVQQRNEFGPERNAFLFLPGEYHVNVPVGFNTEVKGVGASPDDVRIVGDLHADAALRNNNATTTFWRGVEGLSVAPTGGSLGDGTMQWAVSQAVVLRRMHVRGDLTLHQKGGWASGGWMADSLVDGTVASGPQQQWISRNAEWGTWTGSNWNMVFVGVVHEPAGEWPKPAYTRVERTPVVREKPFLAVSKAGKWGVRVPELRTDSVGISWKAGETRGRTIPLERFYIAKPETDTAATINKQLAAGKNLIFAPGIYELKEPVQVLRKDTVVLGLGFATLKPVAGTVAMETADADGITVAGLLFDAGMVKSPVLLRVGAASPKSALSHAKNPIAIFDVFFRVGGAGAGATDGNLEVDANDTIVDHTWIWRADHGKGAGWTTNPSRNGLVVNADRVTIYGLFVEHHQEYQVVWNGEGGRTYFYQSEIPYDPPTQASYTSGAGANGWASYKVADTVTTHEAWGLGVYSVFRHPDVVLSRAIEVPHKPGVRFHDMVTVALDNLGQITHVIDDVGEAATTSPKTTPRVTSFP